jgi:hypothetical protein
MVLAPGPYWSQPDGGGRSIPAFHPWLVVPPGRPSQPGVVQAFVTGAAGVAAQLVGIFRLLAAAWFAPRWPGSVAMVLTPHGFWQHLRYRDPVTGVIGLAVALAGQGRLSLTRRPTGDKRP